MLNFSINNKLIQGVRESRRKIHWLLYLLGFVSMLFITPIIVAVIFYFPVIIGGSLISGFGGNKVLVDTYSFTAFDLVVFTGAGIFAVFFWTKIIEKRKISTLGFTGSDKLRKYLLGFFFGFLMMAATAAGILATGTGSLDNSMLAVSGMAAIPTMLIVLVGWIVQGASEEILVRGWIMPRIAQKFGLATGVAVSSLVFSALHLLNDGVSVLPIINLTLYGIFAALYALYEEGIIGICALHSAWNFTQGNIFGFLVSGESIKGGSLIGIQLNDSSLINGDSLFGGNSLINGGAFGPEGGLIVTFVECIGILIVIRLQALKVKKVVSAQSKKI